MGNVWDEPISLCFKLYNIGRIVDDIRHSTIRLFRYLSSS